MTDATDATDADHRPGPARPVPRGAGQLSDAAPDRRRGSIAGGVRASWWYSVSGLVMLIGAGHALMLIPAFLRDEAESARAVLIAVLCVVSAGMQLAFSTGMRRGMGMGVHNWPIAGAMIVAGAAILAIAAPLQWSSLPLITAVSLVACQLGGRAWWAAIAVSAAAIAVENAAMPDGSGHNAASFALHAFFPLMTWATVWAWDIVRRLDDARSTEGRLAVARERLRFAADLHDIQGHTLQVIALKSELAERLLPANPNPDAAPSDAAPIDPARVAAARAQIAEIRQLAADAMADTRELVQGYRAPALEDELDNARDVLAAADFDCTIDAADLRDDPAARAVFGRVLREATTNVLRHGTPGPVDVALGRGPAGSPAAGSWVLTVGNVASAARGSSSSKKGGSGIAGLRERVTEAGGTLTALYDEPAPASPGATGRFTLTATIPATKPETATDQEVPR